MSNVTSLRDALSRIPSDAEARAAREIGVARTTLRSWRERDAAPAGRLLAIRRQLAQHGVRVTPLRLLEWAERRIQADG